MTLIPCCLPLLEPWTKIYWCISTTPTSFLTLTSCKMSRCCLISVFKGLTACPHNPVEVFSNKPQLCKFNQCTVSFSESFTFSQGWTDLILILDISLILTQIAGLDIGMTRGPIYSIKLCAYYAMHLLCTGRPKCFARRANTAFCFRKLGSNV